MMRSPPASSLPRAHRLRRSRRSGRRQGDPATLDHAIGEHDAGVADDGVGFVESSQSLPSCRRGKRRHIDDAVGNPDADLVVMHDRHHRDTGAFLLTISSTTTSRLAASSDAVGSSSSRIGRSEMKPRAMLTRCCSPPENVDGGNVQSRSGILRRRSSRPPSRAPRARAAIHDQRLRDHVERRHARHRTQELADITDGRAATLSTCRGSAVARSITPP